jgi:hypothetical protein
MWFSFISIWDSILPAWCDNNTVTLNQSSSQAFSWDQSTLNNNANSNIYDTDKNQCNFDFKIRNQVENSTIIEFSSEALRSIDITVSIIDL